MREPGRRKAVMWSFGVVTLIVVAGAITLGLLLTKGNDDETASASSAPTAVGAPQSTSSTAAALTTTAASDPASMADAAIAAVTKSDAIDTPKTIKAGILMAGSDTSLPPMEFSDGEGGYIGFDVDLCAALAAKMGLELEVVSTNWDGIIPALMSDRFDIIMSAMSITEERLKQINFSDPYLRGILAITTPVDRPIGGAADLVDKTVGVQVDTTAQFAVEEIEGVKEIRKYVTVLEAFMDLAAGRLDAVVNDEPVNAYIIETNAGYKGMLANTGGIATDQNYGYAIKKESADLLAAMNVALAELRAEGVYAKILAKWGLAG